MTEPTENNQPALVSVAKTHTGNRRPHNEDAYALVPDLGLYVVADGMGGHEGGEVASRIVVEHVTQAVREGASLSEAASGAHRAVVDAVDAGDGRKGMGATLVAVRFQGDAFEVVWAGDSRAYQFGGKLQQLTHDHSVVQEMVDLGALSESDARQHPERSLITRAMGMPDAEEMPVERTEGQLGPGERLLLCSDGLTEELDDEEIGKLLQESRDPESAAARLVDAALEAGGHDNITVVLVQAPAKGWTGADLKRLLVAAGIGLAAAIALSALLRLIGIDPFG